MGWKKYGFIVSALYATVELLSFLFSGATIIISRLPSVYRFVVSIPFLSPSITFFLGILVGAIVAKLYEPEPRLVAPDEVEGCVKRDDVHWRVSAQRRGKNIRSFKARRLPYCPECQTKLKKTQQEPVGLSQSRPFWECVECDNIESRTKEIHSEVEQIARKHMERIIETEGKEFSLDVLTSEIHDQTGKTKPTGKDIWQMYVERMDDNQITTDCFHDSV